LVGDHKILRRRRKKRGHRKDDKAEAGMAEVRPPQLEITKGLLVKSARRGQGQISKSLISPLWWNPMIAATLKVRSLEIGHPALVIPTKNLESIKFRRIKSRSLKSLTLSKPLLVMKFKIWSLSCPTSNISNFSSVIG
jgi:hypothetical protein